MQEAKATAEQHAARPGVETSEFRNTRHAQFVAVLVGVLALVFPDLPSEAVRETLIWIAGVIGVGATASYSLARSRVKSAALQAAAAAAVAGTAAKLHGAR